MELADENGFTYSELCYFQSPTQSNIFSITVLPCMQTPDSLDPKTQSCQVEKNEILVAFLKPGDHLSNKQTCSLYQFKVEKDCIKPSVEYLNFAYIPVQAEIVSLDAFMDFSSHNLVVGIAFTNQESQKKNEPYLNIYREVNRKGTQTLNKMTESCVYLELGFQPLQLTHTMILTARGNLQYVFVMAIGEEVSGGMAVDGRSAMVYHEGYDSDGESERLIKPQGANLKENCSYQEMGDVETRFPELTGITGKIFRMDFRVLHDDLHRLSAFGTDLGGIYFNWVDLKTLNVLRRCDFRHDSPITDVRLLNLITRWEFIHPVFSDEGAQLRSYKAEDFSLMVCSSVESSVVYSDVVDCGLSLDNQLVLPGSSEHDCVLCCCLADIDMDGRTELLVGTFGQDLLVYKAVIRETIEGSSSKTPRVEEFKLVCCRKFTGPIHSLRYTDVTGDGVKELVVLTTKGVHFMQVSLSRLVKLIQTRLDEFDKEQSNNPIDSSAKKPDIERTDYEANVVD